MVIKDFDPIPESNEDEELYQLRDQIRCNAYDRNKPQLLSAENDIESFLEEHYLLFKSYRAGNSTMLHLRPVIDKFFDALALYNNK